MGFTPTLMPLLQELCALAEDIHQNTGTSRAIANDVVEWPLPVTDISTVSTQALLVADLRSRLQLWRPKLAQGVSARTSRRLLAQAFATRAAALLMLHRLVNPAGSATEAADNEAFQMACEVMVHLNGEPEDLRLSTWATFVASCELQSREDRDVAIGIFDAIYSSRRTGTALQTKKFVIERVWKARDGGENWNWMALSRRYPRECVPI